MGRAMAAILPCCDLRAEQSRKNAAGAPDAHSTGIKGRALSLPSTFGMQPFARLCSQTDLRTAYRIDAGL